MKLTHTSNRTVWRTPHDADACVSTIGLWGSSRRRDMRWVFGGGSQIEQWRGRNKPCMSWAGNCCYDGGERRTSSMTAVFVQPVVRLCRSYRFNAFPQQRFATFPQGLAFTDTTILSCDTSDVDIRYVHYVILFYRVLTECSG